MKIFTGVRNKSSETLSEQLIIISIFINILHEIRQIRYEFSISHRKRAFVIKISEILYRTIGLMSKKFMENSFFLLELNEVDIILMNLDNYVPNMKMIELRISLVTFTKYLPYCSFLFNVILRKVLK